MSGVSDEIILPYLVVKGGFIWENVAFYLDECLHYLINIRGFNKEDVVFVLD